MLFNTYKLSRQNINLQNYIEKRILRTSCIIVVKPHSSWRGVKPKLNLIEETAGVFTTNLPMRIFYRGSTKETTFCQKTDNLCTIDLLSQSIAQFTKNHIIHKRTQIIHKIKHESTSFLKSPA